MEALGGFKNTYGVELGTVVGSKFTCHICAILQLSFSIDLQLFSEGSKYTNEDYRL